MDIVTYFNKLNTESQAAFSESILKKDKLGSLHHLSSCIYEFSACVVDLQEKRILETVGAQLESSNYNVVLGLYRQAFSSLRLALEMGLAAIYFSTRKLELYEWLDGRMDIKWSVLVNAEDGVLSKRFTRAFCDEATDEVDGYRNKAVDIYRKLSEYVHGNNETWINGGIHLSYKEHIFDKYCDHYRVVCEVILFSIMIRYLKFLDEGEREALQFLPEEFNHIMKIRNLLGQS